MRVLCHHIYEYKKGLRNLVLHTLRSEFRNEAEEVLLRSGISYVVRDVPGLKINIFFGADECVKIIEDFGEKHLHEFSDEEDFILGVMLGYCRMQQCRRYLLHKSCKDKEPFSVFNFILRKQLKSQEHSS